jgi:hypothetical protein
VSTELKGELVSAAALVLVGVYLFVLMATL